MRRERHADLLNVDSDDVFNPAYTVAENIKQSFERLENQSSEQSASRSRPRGVGLRALDRLAKPVAPVGRRVRNLIHKAAGDGGRLL